PAPEDDLVALQRGRELQRQQILRLRLAVRNNVVLQDRLERLGILLQLRKVGDPPERCIVGRKDEKRPRATQRLVDAAALQRLQENRVMPIGAQHVNDVAIGSASARNERYGQDQSSQQAQFHSILLR